MMSHNNIIQNKKDEAKYLVKWLLLANFIQFMEAGAVPALLISLARYFELDHAQLGLLGGGKIELLDCIVVL